jgi:dUTP pyrophosphatase
MSTVPSATSPPTSPPAKRHKPSNSIAEAVTTTTKDTTTMADTTTDNSSNGTTAPNATTLDQAPPLLIKKLSETAKLPLRGNEFAAGYDIYASQETVIPKRGKGLVETDLSIAVPAGTCTFLPPRHFKE